MLPRELTAALTSAARRDIVLLASDFDGVLSPLQDDPLACRPVAGSIEALRSVADEPGTTAALVSGRDRQTLSAISGVGELADDPIILIASHGGESSRPDLVVPADLDETRQALLARLRDGLDEVAADHPGARVEVKPTSVVLHTRGIDPAIAADAHRAGQALADGLTGTHAMAGKDVLELGVVEMSKGVAITQLASSLGADATIYFGDDVTDEKAFAMMAPERGDVSVKVGAGETVAAYRVDGIPDVVEALQLFARERTSRG